MTSIKFLMLALAAVLFVTTGCGPQTQESCRAAAAKEARSELALSELIRNCESEFPATKQTDGTFSFYDQTTNDWIKVSGARLSSTDRSAIQRNRELKERANAARELSENAAKAEASADILNNTTISYKITCNIDSRYIACYDKNMTVKVNNNSKTDITRMRFDYEIGRGVSCDGSLGKSFDKAIAIPAGGSGSFVENVAFADAGENGSLNGCIKLTAAE